MTAAATRLHHGSGSALLLCLVLLTGLTLLGLAAASDYQMQLRVQANLEQQAQAEQTAEIALGWAEQWLFSLAGQARPEPCQEGCGPGAFILPEATLPAHPEQESPAWWAVNGQQAGHEPVSQATLDQRLAALGARWLVAAIDAPDIPQGEPPYSLAYYRILARGTAGQGRAIAVSESIVLRPWGAQLGPDPLPPQPGAQGLCQREAIAPCGRVAWRSLR